MALRTAAASKPDGRAADEMSQSKVSVVSEQEYDEREAENLVCRSHNLVFERMDDLREMGKGARIGGVAQE